MLTDIDVSATLKAKLGEDLSFLKDPRGVQTQLEDKIGTMLPCNVIVQQHADGAVEVSAVDPVASMQAIGDPASPTWRRRCKRGSRGLSRDCSAKLPIAPPMLERPNRLACSECAEINEPPIPELEIQR